MQDLQAKKLITIVATPDFSSVVFPGEPLTEEAFKSLISEAEHASSNQLEERVKTKNY